MKIYKYQIGSKVIVEDVIRVYMPEGAQILHVQSQKEVPCIWALVDPGAKREERFFFIAGTGEDILDGEYIGTVSQFSATYIWHIFEV